MTGRKRGRRAPAKGRAMQETKAAKVKRLRPVDYLVDVVIPVYGEWGFLANSIRHIPSAFEGMEEPYRVIVIDNGTPGWE